SSVGTPSRRPTRRATCSYTGWMFGDRKVTKRIAPVTASPPAARRDDPHAARVHGYRVRMAADAHGCLLPGGRVEADHRALGTGRDPQDAVGRDGDAGRAAADGELIDRGVGPGVDLRQGPGAAADDPHGVVARRHGRPPTEERDVLDDPVGP